MHLLIRWNGVMLDRKCYSNPENLQVRYFLG